MADLGVYSRYKGFGDLQRAEEEFQLKKAVLAADAQAKRDAMELQRQQLNSMTPYQAASLEMQARRLAAQEAKGGMTVDPDTGEIVMSNKPSKPLPVGALKLQDEAIDALQTATSVQSDLGAIKQNIESGKLNLGTFTNPISAAKNYLGVSDENSRNYATFKAALEKLRNDSLRLNKGVQTEGDAVRAWNELMSNVNDEGVVRQRLEEIARINERAQSLQQLRIDEIRRNYGAEDFDYSRINQSAFPTGGNTTSSGGWKIEAID